MAEPTITLYTGQSPNGVKISILLEELGLPYKVYKLNMIATEQKTEWFTIINPNGKNLANRAVTIIWQSVSRMNATVLQLLRLLICRSNSCYLGQSPRWHRDSSVRERKHLAVSSSISVTARGPLSRVCVWRNIPQRLPNGY